MKRNVKNDKVLRAITIGLATMIAATSAPVNVYAGEADDTTPSEPVVEETEPADDSSTEGDNSESGDGGAEEVSQENNAPGQEFAMTTESYQSAVSVPMDPTQALSEISNVVGAEGTAGTLDGIVNPVEAQVPGALPVAIADATITVGADSTLVQNLNEAQNDLVNGVVGEDGKAIGGVEENLETLQSGLKSATGTNDKNVTSEDVFATTTGGTVLATDEDGDYPRNEDEDSEDAGKPQFDANGQLLTVSTNDPLLADFYDSYSDALGALNGLNTLQSESARATAMGTVYGFVQDASIKLDAARDSITGLRNAIKDTKAAEAAVERAEAKAQAIEAVRDQYYAMMLRYFASKSAVDYKDGSNEMDIDKSAAKMGKDNVNAIAANCTDQTVLQLGRSLLEKMVKAELSDKYDIQEIQFATNKTGKDEFGFGYSDAYMTDGVVYQDKNKHDQVVTVKLNGNNAVSNNVTINGETYKADPQKISQIKSNQGDQGKTNRFEVTFTYKDENGESKTKTKYYNYIFKSFGENEALDLSHGIVDLAEVVREQDKDDNGNPKVDKKGNPVYVFKANGVDTIYDDYALLDAYVAKAKDNVEAAKEKVKSLSKQVETLGMYATNTGTVEKMEARLAEAEIALANSEKVFVVLNALLDGYQGPAIKNSPSGNPEDPDGPTGGDEDPGTSGGTPVYDPGTGTLSIPGYVIPPISVPGPSGVAGVRRGTSSGVAGVRSDNIEDNKDIVRKIVEPKKNVATVNNKKGKKITNPAVPLAATPFEDGAEMSWWWLLVIFLLGATGKKLYDEYKKKKEAEEAAKNIND